MDEYQPLNDALGSFRMPLFFFLSGVTFPAHRGVGTIARQRADALLKPFAVMVLLTGLVRSLEGSPSMEQTLLALSYATGFTVSCGPLWFLPHLWLLSVLAAPLLALVQAPRAAVRRVALLGVLIVAGCPLLGAFPVRRWPA
jgi:fucose 4-O-acetylase-like acetyltransferase